MAETSDSDHDTLVRIETMIGMMSQQQADFYKTYDQRHSELVGRVVSLEVKQAANIAQLQNNSDEIASLRKTGSIWGLVNSVGALIAGVLGVKLGP